MGMTGRIIKGVAGSYYVLNTNGDLFECKARGGFRNDGIKPLVGDLVELSVLDEAKRLGCVEKILPRKNEVLRPASANLDQVMIVFASAKPAPNFDLLDRFLIRMKLEGIPVMIGFNKDELVEEEQKKEMLSVFQNTGYPVYFFSVKAQQGLSQVRNALLGKTTALAGPSGVGKSSLINYLCPQAEMETGDISRKIERGKHTTRHAELFSIDLESFIMDTPGFSTLYLNEILPQDLWTFFPEMLAEEKNCRFTGCSHMEEPDCGVKAAVKEGRIHPKRYESYRMIYKELAAIKRY